MQTFVVVLSIGEYDEYAVRNLYAGTDPSKADAVAKAHIYPRPDGTPFSVYIEVWKDGKCTQEVIMAEWGDI